MLVAPDKATRVPGAVSQRAAEAHGLYSLENVVLTALKQRARACTIAQRRRRKRQAFGDA